ncbi:8398_t:CDS:10 [Paraglomus brasilianum]|uniref:8398_t:CDS:1 n=1 Tax=Paraglomus brasilianum TaxID=144538 RepID=A0A9N8Z7Z9_9GLOM|nr:8398_t:CDS:10 [Paraglomus brasilianum]
MTTASTRRIQSRRDNSRQAAFSFLSNISLGTENAFTQNNRRVTGVPDTFGSSNLISVDSYEKRPQPNTQHFTDTSKSKLNGLRIDTKRSRDPDKTLPVYPVDSSNGQVPLGGNVFSNGETSTIEQDDEDEPPLWNKRSRSDSVRAQAATSFLSNISLGGKDGRPHRISKENESVSVKDKTKGLETDAIIEEEIVESLYGPVIDGRGRTNSVSSDDTSSSLSLSPSQSPLGSWQQEGMRRTSIVRHGSYNTNNNSYINPTSFSTNFNNSARANASQQNMILPTISVSPTNLGVFSILKGGDDKTSRRDLRRKHSISENPSRRQAQSYAYLLSPTNALGSENDKTGYDPYDLDDPNISLGKRRPSKAFSSFMGSIMSYSRESDEKREANETFRQKHPQIDTGITLSKIRTIKEKLLAAARNESLNLDLELSTVAMAYSYFEKLIHKKAVDKSNRKVIAAICLFLAVKVNEPRATGLGSLLDSLHKHLDVNEKEIKDHEFSVFAALDFALMLPNEEIMPHFERIFRTLEYKSTEEYLGPNPFYTSSGIS